MAARGVDALTDRELLSLLTEDEQSAEALLAAYGGSLARIGFEDMGTREIAEVLGIKEPTVRTRLVRARKLLKQSLKEAWEDEQPEPIQSHDGRGPCLC